MSETERDVYELDTTVAEKNLAAIYDSLLRVEGQLRESAAASGEVEKSSKSMAAAVFAGNLAFEAVKIGARAFFNAVKEGISGVMEAERATAQLRLVAGATTDALREQAEAMEKAFGVEAEDVQRAQASLLRFGVAAKDVDRVTRAINDYATATGKGLVEATQAVTIAVEQGGGKLENLGVTFKATGHAAGDMAAAADALSKKFGGASAAEANTLAGRTRAVEVAFDDLKKGFGALVTNFASQTGIVDDLRLALEGINIALFGSDQEDHWNKLADLYDQQSRALDSLALAKKELQIAEREGSVAQEEGARLVLRMEKENLETIKEQIAALTGRSKVLENAPPPADRVTKFGADEAEKEEKASLERRTKLFEAFKKNEEELEKESDQRLMAVLEENARSYDKHQKDLTAIQSTGLSERERLMGRSISRMSTAVATAAQKAAADAMLGFNVGEGERLSSRITGSLVNAIRAIDGSKISSAYAQSVVGPLVDTLESAAGQLADVLAFQPLKTFLTTNQEYSEAFLNASVERRQAELAEQGIIKTTAELRTEAEREAANEQKKRLAEVLANIAIESAKQAAFQVAEGIGNLASYNYGAAALNFAAAAAYGVIAGASGGAAFAISQSRGMTSSERENLEALKRRDKAKEKRESANSRSSDGAGGTVVNVFNLGITGQTRTAQARELVKIQQDYGALQIGGPNFGGP